MFESNVENYILQDALKIALVKYLKENETRVEVEQGKRGKPGKCIKNSLKYDKEHIAIGFCVFEGKDLINTVDVIVHAINFDNNKYIDNTKLKDYSFYLIEKLENCDMTKSELREEMIEISKQYKHSAIRKLREIYKDIKLGDFRFEEEL